VRTSSRLSRTFAASLAAPIVMAGIAFGQANLSLHWNNATLQGIRDAKLGAPVVSRALAIVHTCMYDAWAAYDERAVGTQLGGALRRPASERTLANKEQAVSYAAYRVSDVAVEHIQFDSGSLGISNLAIFCYGFLLRILRDREQLECNEQQCGT
jgi:hypothetical protein